MSAGDFREDVTYDPNGNILTYRRAGGNSADLLMDNLTYHYDSDNNKLNYISDAQTNTSAYTGDLEDQPSYNYDYDEIGNLSFDANGGLLHNISWSNAQKLRLITSAGDNMTYEFRYNPMQQRVAKLHRYFNNEGIGETRTYYIRDAQGNVMATYRGWGQYEEEGVVTWDSFALAEQHIYGSARVGMAAPELKLYPVVPDNPHVLDSCHYRIFEGWKRYEITNHLGNVLAVITDRKRGQGSSGDIEWFAADVLAAQQYYPFGMLMPGDTSANVRRQYNLNDYDYRYGFNGKEGDDEVKGDDNQQDYGMRIYDPRVARFLSVDPIAREYPELTPYQFASNTPTSGIDLDGLEYYYASDGTYLGKYGTSTQVRLIDETEFNRMKTAAPEMINYQTNENAIFNASTPTFMKNDELLMAAGLAYGETGLDDIAMRAVPNAIFNKHKGYLDQGHHISLGTTMEAALGNLTADTYNDGNARFRMFIGNDAGKKGKNQQVDLMKNASGRNNDTEMKNSIMYVFDAYKFANGEGGKDYSNGATGWHGLDIVSGKNPEARNWRRWLYVDKKHQKYGFQNISNAGRMKGKKYESTLVRKGKEFGASLFYKATNYGKKEQADNLPSKYHNKN